MTVKIERGEDLDMVSDERYSYDVVEWIDKDGNHGHEVFGTGEGTAFAQQLVDKSRRVMIYCALSDTHSATSDIYGYVKDNPRLEVDDADETTGPD